MSNTFDFGPIQTPVNEISACRVRFMDCTHIQFGNFPGHSSSIQVRLVRLGEDINLPEHCGTPLWLAKMIMSAFDLPAHQAFGAWCMIAAITVRCAGRRVP